MQTYILNKNYWWGFSPASHPAVPVFFKTCSHRLSATTYSPVQIYKWPQSYPCLAKPDALEQRVWYVWATHF